MQAHMENVINSNSKFRKFIFISTFFEETEFKIASSMDEG